MIDIYIGGVTNRALKHRSMASQFRNPNNARFQKAVRSCLEPGIINNKVACSAGFGRPRVTMMFPLSITLEAVGQRIVRLLLREIFFG